MQDDSQEKVALSYQLSAMTTTNNQKFLDKTTIINLGFWLDKRNISEGCKEIRKIKLSHEDKKINCEEEKTRIEAQKKNNEKAKDK